MSVEAPFNPHFMSLFTETEEWIHQANQLFAFQSSFYESVH